MLDYLKLACSTTPLYLPMADLFLILGLKQILPIFFCFNMSNNVRALRSSLYQAKSRITSFQVTKNGILQIIKPLDPNKVRSWGNISIKICGESITVPLKKMKPHYLKLNFQRHGKKQICSILQERRLKFIGKLSLN